MFGHGCRALLGVCLATTLAGAQAGSGPPRVVIDPGHGGSDPGAVANGLTEKHLNLDVAVRLRLLLLLDTLDTSGGGAWEVLMTRESDVTVSLQERVDLANLWPADRFVSIHHNSFSSSAASGTETYSYQEGTLSAALRDRVQEELVAALGLPDRGSKTANFFVLRETNMPAILSEGGFLTSPIDAALLASPAGRHAAAVGHLFGLQRHYGLAPYLPFPDPEAYCSAKLNSAGCVPQIGWSGTPSVSAGFGVECSSVLGQKPGVLFWSLQSAATPFLGGTLCVGQPLVRTQAVDSGGAAGSNCTGFLQRALDARYLLLSGVTPGTVMHFQWWYRDPGSSPHAVGLSDGLRVVVGP